jgi:4Fe-4S single cluster domain
LFSQFLARRASSVRVGHATNSSSSHSILLCAAPVKQEGDVEVGPYYGWDHFVLSSEVEKLDYLWAILYRQVENLVRPSTSAWSIKQFLGQRLEETNFAFVRDFCSQALEYVPSWTFTQDALPTGDVDHQSTWNYPLDPETRLPDVDFVRWLREEVLRPEVVVEGGNDNDGGGTLNEGEDLLPYLKRESPESLICHDRGNHWLLYAKSSGLKVRVPKVRGTSIPHTTIPELVDIKITDYCDFGCKFCYQGSTTQGAHAPYSNPITRSNIDQVINKLGVVEVAIGGGEPLTHPSFWTMVERMYAVTVNVTTRRLDLIPAWKLPLLGSVGYSTESPKILQKVLAQIGLPGSYYDKNPWREKLVVHCVLGAMPVADLIAICKIAHEAGIPVLLLAYKNDNRGADFSPHPHEDWIEQIRDAFPSKYGGWSGPSLGVDTPVVERWGSKIEELLQVSPKLMCAGEGTFSMYIDFTKNSFAKASYGCSEQIGFRRSSGYNTEKPVIDQMISTFQSWHT